MATEAQAKAFQSLFDLEWERYSRLHDGAKINLSLSFLLSAASGFALDFSGGTFTESSLKIAAVTFVFFSFAASLLATQISAYEKPIKPIEIIENFGACPPEDNEFFDDLIVYLAAAEHQNSLANDRKAKILLVGRIALLLSLFLLFSGVVARYVEVLNA